MSGSHQHVPVVHLVGRDVLIPPGHRLPPLVPGGEELEEVARADDDRTALAGRRRDVIRRDVNLPDVGSADQGGLEGSGDLDAVDEEARRVELGEEAGLAGGVVLGAASGGGEIGR